MITPWNWPYTMPSELIAPALASGNAVVWAPASSTSVCSVKLAECIVDAELPAGVFSMLTGHGSVVGDEIAGSDGTHAVGFIGSVETGGKVAARAAGKAQLLELGGNGPMVILDDADIDRAAEASLVASFLCAGQSCTAGERFLVHESVRDEFVEKLAAATAREIRLGDPLAEETTMGPLNNEPTAQKMDEHVADALAKGAKLVAGGARADGLPDEPLLAGDRAGRRDRRDGGRDRGDLRPGDPDLDDRRATRRRCRSSTPRQYGLLTAVWTRDLGRGLRFAEAAHAGLGERQRVDELLGEPAPVRRPLGQEVRASGGSAARTRCATRSPS